jgi:hypothetical protein
MQNESIQIAETNLTLLRLQVVAKNPNHLNLLDQNNPSFQKFVKGQQEKIL